MTKRTPYFKRTDTHWEYDPERNVVWLRGMIPGSKYNFASYQGWVSLLWPKPLFNLFIRWQLWKYNRKVDRALNLLSQTPNPVEAINESMRQRDLDS